MDIAYFYSNRWISGPTESSSVHTSALHSVLFVVFLAAAVVWLQRRSAREPRRRPPRKTPLSLRKADVCRELYLPKKVEGEQFDTIVIGSGIGGLCTASLLAQQGQKVLVLERT